MKWYKNMPPVDFSCRHEVLIEDYDGQLTPMDEPYFKEVQVADSVWQILSDGDYSYLVAGDKEGLVIDSGYGCGNLRAFCQTLTDKPVRYIANTHFHFDHTANNYLFDKAYMSKESVGKCSLPNASFGNIRFPTDYPIEVIGEGFIFDLGGTELETYEFSDHSPGSLAFLDKTHRILFAGDEMVAENYRIKKSFAHSYSMILKFKALQPWYDMICTGPGVYGAPLVDEYLEAFDYLKDHMDAGVKPLPVFPPSELPDGRHRAVYPRRLARSCDLWRHPDPDFEYKRELVYKKRRIEYWTNKL